MPLFRRGKRQPAAPADDAILAIAVAEPTLTASLQMFPTGKAGLTFRPDDNPFFADLESEVRQLLESGEQTAGTRYSVVTDEYGYRWIILADDQFEDLAMAVYTVGQSFIEHNCRDQLLAAVFPFAHEGQEVQWIFTYKHGTFYPFIPVPGTQRRDNQTEMGLSEKVAEHLPVEKRLEQWYALWGAPFDEV